MVVTRGLVVDGVRQVYRVAGAGPVCLVHSGGPGVHPEYLRMPDLERGLTMVYIDPVGSGDSDLLPDGDYSMSRYARFAAAVLDDVGASTAYFLGHSHGGFVGLQFGLDHPDRLDGLVLYDTAPLFGPELRETATREMAAFTRRWPHRPEAAEAGRVWDAVNVTMTRKVTDHDSYLGYLQGILPAYFADHRETFSQSGGRESGTARKPRPEPAAGRLGRARQTARDPFADARDRRHPRLHLPAEVGAADARRAAGRAPVRADRQRSLRAHRGAGPLHRSRTRLRARPDGRAPSLTPPP